MAKIKTYSLDATVSLTDLILGTDSDDNSLTKNILVSDLLTLFGEQIVVSQLESYDESGERALGTVVAKIGDYDDSGRSTKITVDDNTQVVNVQVGTFMQLSGTTGISKLSTGSLTTTRTHTLQDADGTLAHVSDIFSGDYADLSNTPSIPANTSDLTNDGDGVSAFARTIDLPTTTSELTNDAGFITIASVPTLTSDLTNDGDGVNNFATVDQLPVKTSDITNDGADSTSTYVETDELSTVATSGSYNDLSDVPNGLNGLNVTAKATNYNAVNGDYVVVDATLGAIVITLPAPTINSSVFVIKKDSSGFTVTVDGNGADTINGVATQVLSGQYDKVKVFADGTEWFVE